MDSRGWWLSPHENSPRLSHYCEPKSSRIGNSCNLRSGNEIFSLSCANYFIYRYLSRSAIKKNRAPSLPVSVSLPNWDCTHSRTYFKPSSPLYCRIIP